MKIKKEVLEKAITEMTEAKTKFSSGEANSDGASSIIEEIIQMLQKLIAGASEEEKREKEEEKTDDNDNQDNKDEDDNDDDSPMAEEVKEVIAKLPIKDKHLIEKAIKEATDKAKIVEAEKNLLVSEKLVDKLLKESHLPAGTYNDLKEVLIGKTEKYCKKI